MYQFLIVLCDTDPLVWRRIQVPLTYTFWDLHVAIQDAMGWQDYHLHEFQARRPRGRQMEIFGIPLGDSLEPGREVKPSRTKKIADYFDYGSLPCLYTYDLGDNWVHAVVVEGATVMRGPEGVVRCLGGARRCPPEDVGGKGGYQRFLEIIADPNDPEHEDYLGWVGGHYDPNDFDPAQVTFDDPQKRWDQAFR